MRTMSLRITAYGENASDVGDFRPGAQAAKEFQVRTPLKEAGLTKAEICELSAQLGLPTADKPQMACLSSRIPYGEAVTPEKLRMIEDAEVVLRDLGFYDLRVRHHELRAPTFELGNSPQAAKSPTAQHLARIEVGPEEMKKFLNGDLPGQVSSALRKIGYAHVSLDLAGYRRGSGNEIIFRQPSARD